MQTADFTIAEFLAWVRTKPADEEYHYVDYRNCAVAQYGRAVGREELTDLGSSALRKLNPDICEAVNPGSRFNGMLGATFGQLRKRLEALLPAEPLSGTWTKADAYLTDIEDVARERVVS